MDRIGDIRINLTNEESNVVGYVCVEGGNPGKWNALIKGKVVVDTKFYNDNGTLVTFELKTDDFVYYTIESSITHRGKAFTNILHSFIEPEGNKDKAISIFNSIYKDLL